MSQDPACTELSPECLAAAIASELSSSLPKLDLCGLSLMGDFQCGPFEWLRLCRFFDDLAPGFRLPEQLPPEWISVRDVHHYLVTYGQQQGKVVSCTCEVAAPSSDSTSRVNSDLD